MSPHNFLFSTQTQATQQVSKGPLLTAPEGFCAVPRALCRAQSTSKEKIDRRQRPIFQVKHKNCSQGEAAPRRPIAASEENRGSRTGREGGRHRKVHRSHSANGIRRKLVLKRRKSEEDNPAGESLRVTHGCCAGRGQQGSRGSAG